MSWIYAYPIVMFFSPWQNVWPMPVMRMALQSSTESSCFIISINSSQTLALTVCRRPVVTGDNIIWTKFGYDRIRISLKCLVIRVTFRSTRRTSMSGCEQFVFFCVPDVFDVTWESPLLTTGILQSFASYSWERNSVSKESENVPTGLPER